MEKCDREKNGTVGFIGICKGGYSGFSKTGFLKSQNRTVFRFQNYKSGFQIPNQT